MLIQVADIGSNSIKCSVFEVHDGVLRRLRDSRLGLSLGEQVYGEGSLRPGVAAEIAEFIQASADGGIVIDVIFVLATAAVRDAPNREAFVQELAEQFNISVRVLSGEEESFLIHRGMVARGKFRPGETVLTLDIGGGSAEIAWSRDGEMLFTGSCELGAILITRKFMAGGRFTREVAERIRTYAFSQLDQMCGTQKPESIGQALAGSGNIRAVGRMSDRLRGGNSRRGLVQITRGSLEEILEAARDRNTFEISRLFRLQRSRARIVMPAVVVLEAVMQYFDIPLLTLSEAGLREGAALTMTAKGNNRIF